MSPLLPRCVIREKSTNHRFRLVKFSGDDAVLFKLPSNPNSRSRELDFRRYSREHLEGWLQSGRMEVLDEHPYWPPSHKPAILTKGPSEEAESIRDYRYAAVSRVLSAGLDSLIGSGKSQLLAAVAKEVGASRQAVGKWTSVFLTLGMVENALLPRFCDCGGKGKKKAVGEDKRGAPPLVEGLGGCNVTPEMAEGIDEFLARRRKSGLSVSELHNEYTTTECYDGKEVGPFGEIRKILLPPNLRPTLEVFDKRYHAIDYQEKIAGRVGETNWNKKYREILGSEAARAEVPGAVYQIDFSRANVLLRHPYYNVNIGRPALGLVVDVGSPMIAALRSSLANPSTQEAFHLLECAFLPKVPYCRRYGVEIEPEQWPVQGLCAKLCADNGELRGRRARVIAKELDIVFENARAYNPTDKGSVERMFGYILNHELRFLPGFAPKHRQRGDPKCSLDGKISPIAFQKILILTLLDRLQDDVRDRFIPTDAIKQGTAPSALELWHWSMRRGLGALLEAPPPDVLRLMFLPEMNVSIQGRGFVFRGLHYVSNEVPRSFYAKHRGRSKETKGVYEPNLIDCIYVKDGDKVYPSGLAEADMAMYGGQGLSFDDVDDIRKTGRVDKRKRRPATEQRKSNHRATIAHIVGEEIEISKHLAHPVGYSIGKIASETMRLQKRLVANAQKKSDARILDVGEGTPAQNQGLYLMPPAKVAVEAGSSSTIAPDKPSKAARPDVDFLRQLLKKPA